MLVVPIEDPASNNILHIALEVCNTVVIRKKNFGAPFNCVLVFHFQKAQHQFHWITAHCGCREHVAEDAYRTAPANLDFGAGSSYAIGTSSAGPAHDDDIPDLGPDLDTTVDVLSQLEDAPDLTQPSQTLQGGRA
jgi:hypothetical protein